MHKWVDFVRAQSRCGLFKAKPANRVCYDLSIHLFDCIAMKCHFFTAAVVALLCSKPVFAEGGWIQFLFILKFWLDDTSKGFETTVKMGEKIGSQP